MTYNEWRDELKNNLLSVSEEERRKVLDYYAEAYADRREAGFSEREIIEDFGAPYDAAQRILSENKNDEYFEEPSKVGDEQLLSKEKKPAEQEKRTASAPAPHHSDTPAYANNAPSAKKKRATKWLIAGGVILSILISIVLCVAIASGTLAVNGFFAKPEFEMQTFTAGDKNNALDISIGAGQVKTEFYDGDRIVIDYPASPVFKTEISEKNGVLTYKAEPRRVWFWGSWDIPETTIKLPKDEIYNLDFEIDAGTVNIASGVYGIVNIEINAGTLTMEKLTCDILTCEINAGECKIKELACPNIKAEVNAGSLSIDIDDYMEEYDIKTNVSVGSCNISDQTVEGGKKLRIECSAGAVKVTFKN